MKKLLLGTVLGLLAGFLLFGLEVLPKTLWRWSFGEPIEMSGGLAAPMIIRLPSGTYFYVLDYEKGDKEWYLWDYRTYDKENFWTEPEHVPLTLGLSDSYEVFMLPPDRYSGLWGYGSVVPDTLQLKYIPRQGWFVSDNQTLTRLRVWVTDHEMSYSDIEATIEELSWRIGDLAGRIDSLTRAMAAK